MAIVAQYQMCVGGQLVVQNNLGSEISVRSNTLVQMKGRRGVAGAAGTTTLQLEINGVPQTGATLSWTPSDAAFALKDVTFPSPIAVNSGDRISFRITSVETGAPEDIFAVVF